MYSRGGDLTFSGGISNIVGLGIITGQVVGGVLAERIGHAKYQCVAVFTIGAIFLGCMATTTPDTMGRAIALLTIGCIAIGWNETLCLANATICVRDQREIGVAGGMAGSMRAAMCAVLVAIYTTVLGNRLTQTVAAEVPSALVSAGLPESSVSAYLAAISSGVYSNVPGITDAIIAAGTRAYQVANANAYSTVYLTTIAFSGIAIVLTFYAPNTEKYMTGKVVATLHNENSDEMMTAKGEDERV